MQGLGQCQYVAMPDKLQSWTAVHCAHNNYVSGGNQNFEYAVWEICNL